MAFASRAVSQRGIRDRIAITLWGNRPKPAAAVAPVTLTPAGLTHTRAQGALTVSPQLAPSGLAHTRAQGAPVVSPQLKPAGLAHTRTLGATIVGAVLAPTGLAHTRAQGNPTVSPHVQPAGQAHARALGNPTIPGVTIRQLGALVVTTAGHPRPTGLAHARALGALTVLGRDLQPLGIRHTRAQGNPTLSARALPTGLAHTRGTSSPSVNRLTLTPTGLIHAGAPNQLTLTPVATDNFNRANATIAGANNWLATFDGSMSISSNEATGTNSAIKGDYRSESYTADQYSQVVIGSINNTVGSFTGLTLRNSTSGNDCYAALYYVPSALGAQINIYKRTGGGGFTLLAQHNLGVITNYTAGTTLTFIAEGNQLTAQVNGVGFCTIIDTSITGPGAPGIITFNAITLDNWEGGNAATTALTAATTTDNFNRANNGLSVSQANWTTMTGYPAVDIPIVTNQLNPTTGTHAADVRTDAFPADQWSQIERGSSDVDATGFVGLITRINPALNSGYLGVYFGHAEFLSNAANAPTSYRIYRLDNGASIFLAACASKEDSTGATFNPTGTQYTFISQGARHSFRVNGKEVLAATDATYTTGEPGIMMYPTSTADNWAAGAVPGGRTLGSLSVTTVEILRPTGQAHARAVGATTAHGHLTLAPTGQAHARAQGNPTLSARALPPGLAHTRNLGSPAVNTRTLAPPALARA